jgi:predicted ferric reductase
MSFSRRHAFTRDGLRPTDLYLSGPMATQATTLDHRGYVTTKVADRPAILGYLLILLLVAGALVIYFVGAKDVSGRGTWFVIGEVIGITAAVLLPLTAILAVRLRPLEWLFGDMTKVYVAHGIVGLTMFALVTLHPLLYVFGTLPDTGDAAGIIVPFKLVVLDWISWLTIALALLPTLFVRLPFDLWRYTHFFLGAALVDTWISLTITSKTFDTFTLPALRIYLFTLFVLGILAVLYMIVIRRLLEPKHEYRIVGTEHHPVANAIELHLESVAKPLRHEPGQFTYVDLLDDRVQVKRGFGSHPYSISSAPPGDRMSVIVQSQGDTTARIQAIAEHDEARALVHGAYGRLWYGHREPLRRLWLAGGIGVTPFLSLAEELASEPMGRDVVLVVGVDHAEQAFFEERLRAAEERADGHLRVLVWNREERGVPTVAALMEEIPDLPARAVAMSGPDAMIAALTPQLHEVGVPRLHSEIAIGPPRNWRYGSRGLRVMRWVIGVEMAVFVIASLASTVGRAVS